MYHIYRYTTYALFSVFKGTALKTARTAVRALFPIPQGLCTCCVLPGVFPPPSRLCHPPSCPADSSSPTAGPSGTVLSDRHPCPLQSPISSISLPVSGLLSPTMTTPWVVQLVVVGGKCSLVVRRSNFRIRFMSSPLLSLSSFSSCLCECPPRGDQIG